jgi:pimeloyl-ACP methyl ester carboxylesterase
MTPAAAGTSLWLFPLGVALDRKDRIVADRKADTGSDAGFIMAYEDSADRVPVLWIHGYPLNNTMWDLQVADLADVARSLTPDLRGHGLTEPTPGTPYTMALLADDCVRLLDHLGHDGPVVVAGLSMGGYVALEICRRAPERVMGLILAATRAGPDSDAAKAARDESARVAATAGVGPIVEGLLPKMFAPRTYEEEPDLVAFLRDMMLTTTPQGIVGALAAMRDRPDSTPDLPDLDVPALVIHGEDDQLIPPAEAEAMAAALPAAELVLIPGAGHMVNLDQPAAFDEAVRGFLESFYEA